MGGKKHNTKDVKSDGPIHPYSRKANQLQRAILRTGKLNRQKKERSESHPEARKVNWFQANLPVDKHVLSDSEMHSLIQDYLCRFDEEIETLLTLQRKNRPRSPRLDLLQALQEREEQEYSRGSLELPDLTTTKIFEIVSQWNGDLNTLQTISLRAFKRPDVAVANQDLSTPAESEDSNTEANDMLQ